jgi:hypothetical protein
VWQVEKNVQLAELYMAAMSKLKAAQDGVEKRVQQLLAENEALKRQVPDKVDPFVASGT